MQFPTILALTVAAAVQADHVVTPIYGGPSSSAAAPPSTTAWAAPESPSVYVVDSFTTVCPEPTTFYYEDVCYTATSAYQTVTVTNCPCTMTATPTSYVAATTKPPVAYVTAGANNMRAAAGGVLGALAAGAAALVL
ncbi:unnamed protein product [Discula destructiva]